MILQLFLDTEDKTFFSDEARTVIGEVCRQAEPEIRALLPDLPPTVEVAAQTGTFVLPETGETGAAVLPVRVNWTVNPSHPSGLQGITRSRLRPTLFHECHHLVRFAALRKDDTVPTLMDRVVNEGLATAFERDFGGSQPPWGEYSVQAAAWVQELLRVPSTEDITRWMFKHPDGRRWIGYLAGTYIADLAIEATGHSAAELVVTPTQEILRSAGLDGA